MVIVRATPRAQAERARVSLDRRDTAVSGRPGGQAGGFFEVRNLE